MLKLWDPFMNFDKKSLFNTMFFEDTFNHIKRIGMDYKKHEDGSYTLTMDVPGVKEEDLNIEITKDNILVIKGERKTDTSSYSIKKSFCLSDQIDTDSIKAELKNGVLTIFLSAKSLPPSEEVKKIPITVNK